MTSAPAHVCYASIATVLFEHLEQDLLNLTSVLLDDEDELAGPPPAAGASLPVACASPVMAAGRPHIQPGMAPP